MPTNVRALVAVVLIGFCSHANAQALCPEMTRLRNDREACHVSIALLADFERYHSEAVRDRDNACAGHPLRPYGADMIQH